MVRRLDYNFVKNEFKKRGYLLLESSYVNAKTKMRFQCSHHPEKELNITYDSFKRGAGCKYCSLEMKSESQKLKYEEVVEIFKEYGLTLVSKDYINAKMCLNYICKNGHLNSTTLNSIRTNGGVCRECSNERLSEKFRLSFETVKDAFEKEGYHLITGYYTNYNQKLEYKCPNGHIGEMNYNNFKYGKRCPICSGVVKHEYEEVKEEFKKRGYTLLSDNYVDNYSNLDFICDRGHFSKISYASFRRGSGCRYCSPNAKFTYEEVKSVFENRGYKLITKEYVNSRNLLSFECPNGHIGEMAFRSFKKGCNCLECLYNSRRGDGNPLWKGGISKLHQFLRGTLSEWKKLSMRNSNYKCIVTGETFDDVHHLYGFDLILQEVLDVSKLYIRDNISMYTEIELNKLTRLCIEIHKKHPLGVCLRGDVHNLFHKLYGYGGNTPDQFKEFQIRWNIGEFETLFNYEKDGELN